MSKDRTRRSLLQATLAVGATTLVAAPRVARAAEAPQRTIIVMCDGLGLEYYDRSPMPTLKAWAAKGVHARAQAVMPSVTNCNNASICCGVWPSAHGVIGNSYFDEATGTEEYMEDAKLLLAPTIFERAGMRGVRSALLSSKKKTIGLLNKGTDIVLTAEAPNGDWEAGSARHRPSTRARSTIGFSRRRSTSCATDRRSASSTSTPPTTRCTCGRRTRPKSQEHLSRLDGLLAELAAAAPDAAILLAADHGMNFKTRCWDLEKAMQERGAPVRIAISAERDKYLAHHQGMGGTAWVHLRNPRTRPVSVALLGRARRGRTRSDPRWSSERVQADGEPPRRPRGRRRSRHGFRHSRYRHGSPAQRISDPWIDSRIGCAGDASTMRHRAPPQTTSAQSRSCALAVSGLSPSNRQARKCDCTSISRHEILLTPDPN